MALLDMGPAAGPSIPALEATLEKQHDEVIEYVVEELKRKMAAEKAGPAAKANL